MDGPVRILGLVARVRARLWRQESVRLLRLGLYGSAAVLSVGGGLRLWLGSPVAGYGLGAIMPWLPGLLGTAAVLAAGALAARRRPSAAMAARTADAWAHAAQLLITAWEIVHRGEPATAAGLIVVRQAERALPQWEARVRARHPQPTPVGLLPPLLLCGATILWCILSASAGQAPRAANTASPPPIEAAPGVGLAAAIADLSPPADSATAPVAPVAPGSKFPRGDQTGHGRLESIRDEDRDGGPTSAADLGPGAVVPNHPASVQPTGSAQAGAPQGRPVTPVTDAGTSPSTQAGGAAGAQGAGTQVAPRHEDHAAADQGVAPAIPSVAFGRQPLDRTGAPSADPRRAGHPFDPVAPGLAAAPAPSPARTAPAAAPAPRLDAGLGAAQRALLARYRTELSSRSMTGE